MALADPEDIKDPAVFVKEAWFRYEKECGVQVVGLAASYDSAVELLQQMITDVYRDRGSVDSDAIRAYFTGR